MMDDQGPVVVTASVQPRVAAGASVFGEFKGPLHIQYEDGCTWTILRPFRWCGPDAAPICFEVPEGFVTDFASVPRFFWRLLPPTGKYGKAAVIHDFLYRTGAVPRVEADDTFYRAMLALGVIWPTRLTMWLAVRCFGWFAYCRAAPK